MTDTDIKKVFSIPTRTLQDWKKRDKDNWRHILYGYLKSRDKQAVGDSIKEVRG